MLRNLRKEFGVAVGASEAAIRIDTDEIDDAIKAIASVCKKHGWELRVFDSLVGTQWYVGEPEKKTDEGGPPTKKNASAILDAMNDPGAKPPPSIAGVLHEFWLEPAKPDKATPGEVTPVVLVIKNFHLGFERNRETMVNLVQHLVGDRVKDHKEYESLRAKRYDPNKISPDNDTGKFVVGLMPPEAQLPPEVDPLFKKLVHELPGEEELGSILDDIVPASDDEEGDNTAGLTEEDRKKACKFALGLTRLQAEGVFSSCLVQFGRIMPEYVWQQKSEILNREKLVELYRGTETFDDVVGMAGLKAVLTGLLTPDEYSESDVEMRAKGVLAVGAPGTGKTFIAKAAGNTFGLPTVMVNPAALKGSYVGQSERNTRKMFQILKLHAPCIAIVDEVEKVMPKSGGHQGDNGVSAAMEGMFLTAMNDMTEPVFWFFTANSVKGMHEAFFRAERVDGTFYVRLPGPVARAAAWKQYAKRAFPKEVTVGKQTVAFPRYVNLDVAEVLGELKLAKKVNPLTWAERFILPLMCLPPEKRASAIEKIRAVNENVAQSIKPIDDSGWSPAEIKSCCRLARVLKEPVSATQHRVRPVSVTAAKVIESLEDWAAEAALDAETGQLYTPDEITDETVGDNRVVKDGGIKKVRRKVRHISKSDKDD